MQWEQLAYMFCFDTLSNIVLRKSMFYLDFVQRKAVSSRYQDKYIL